MKPKPIHRNDAILLLEVKQPHNLKVWKRSTEDFIEYKEATCIGGFKRKGTHLDYGSAFWGYPRVSGYYFV